MSPNLFFGNYPVNMVAGLRRDLSCSKSAVSIVTWRKCLEAQPGVVLVQPLLKADGSSRKFVVDLKVIESGGGHLCPHELYVFLLAR